VGDFIGGAGSEELVLRDRRSGVYKRLVIKDDCVTGAVLYGDVRDGPWYFDLIEQKTNIRALRHGLLFGESHCKQGEPACM
jgi:nitrite reductase (NADH) large subunit